MRIHIYCPHRICIGPIDMVAPRAAAGVQRDVIVGWLSCTIETGRTRRWLVEQLLDTHTRYVANKCFERLYRQLTCLSNRQPIYIYVCVWTFGSNWNRAKCWCRRMADVFSLVGSKEQRYLMRSKEDKLMIWKRNEMLSWLTRRK